MLSLAFTTVALSGTMIESILEHAQVDIDEIGEGLLMKVDCVRKSVMAYDA